MVNAGVVSEGCSKIYGSTSGVLRTQGGGRLKHSARNDATGVRWTKREIPSLIVNAAKICFWWCSRTRKKRNTPPKTTKLRQMLPILAHLPGEHTDFWCSRTTNVREHAKKWRNGGGFREQNFTGEVGHPDTPTDRPGYVPHLEGSKVVRVPQASRFVRAVLLYCATAGQTQMSFRALLKQHRISRKPEVKTSFAWCARPNRGLRVGPPTPYNNRAYGHETSPQLSRWSPVRCLGRRS